MNKKWGTNSKSAPTQVHHQTCRPGMIQYHIFADTLMLVIANFYRYCRFWKDQVLSSGSLGNIQLFSLLITILLIPKEVPDFFYSNTDLSHMFCMEMSCPGQWPGHQLGELCRDRAGNKNVFNDWTLLEVFSFSTEMWRQNYSWIVNIAHCSSHYIAIDNTCKSGLNIWRCLAIEIFQSSLFQSFLSIYTLVLQVYSEVAEVSILGSQGPC